MVGVYYLDRSPQRSDAGSLVGALGSFRNDLHYRYGDGCRQQFQLLRKGLANLLW